jgi:hypothetical protein
MGIDDIVWRKEVLIHCLHCGKTGYGLHTVFNNHVLVDGKWKLEEIVRCLSCKTANNFEVVQNDSSDAHNFRPIRTYDDYYRRSSRGKDFEHRNKNGR